MPCTIVMPHDAPQTKMASTRAQGARLVLSEPAGGDNREVAANAEAGRLAAETGAVLLHPFDDWDVIEGQGTTGLEIQQQARALGVGELDACLVCCGGGGLSSGIALALAESMAACACYTVEPAAYDDFARSFEAGRRLAVDGNPPTLCEALQAATPGEKTFALSHGLGVRGLRVSDAEAVEAMRLGFEQLKLVLEPSGAVALAAALHGRIETADRVTCVVASGGNISAADFGRALGCKAAA